MIISWYGEGCFKIQNGDITVLTDVPQKMSGIAVPRLSPSIYIKTLTPWPMQESAAEEKADSVIVGAGEYDVAGVQIRGHELIGESSKNFFKTTYLITWEDIRIGLLGHIASDLPPEAAEDFEEIDVMIGPGAGDPFLEQEKMAKLVKQLNPKIFIPSFFHVSGLKRKAEKSDELVNMFNGEVVKDQEKLVFKKKDLAEIKKTRVVCLKP